ncbi:MAG: class I tRNA ligase family protein [Christensenellales bacterium]
MNEFLRANRPKFPKRAIITTGMPYGNKELHFGHVGGMMIQADCFARFMRDRIGKENVIMQSGTDCYGSPVMEGYRKLIENGENVGSMLDYVMDKNKKHKEVFSKYEIGYDFFGASAFGDAKEIHEKTCGEIFTRLYEVGALKKMDTLQFYDEEKQTFLNGRQVLGKCPVDGCKSEKAYADECDLGHQFMPKDLIEPISTLSGKRPVLKPITNWYFDMAKYNDFILQWLDSIEADKRTRNFVVKELKEFLKLPEIYILRREQMEIWENVKDKLPHFEITEDNEKKPSFTIQFKTLEDREKACEILNQYNMRFRTGKTLVPFRLTANIEWGVKAPEIEGLKDLTFYVWPESLWAPISFTKTYLELHKEHSHNDWKEWWCSDDAEVYQFLGEDNMYFYGPCEMAMFLAMQGDEININASGDNIRLPKLIVNKHIFFLGSKASSSGSVRPPMAEDLLKYYTVEQLRMHFLGMGLGNASVSFNPKYAIADAKESDADIVEKEGNLLTNVFNRVLRHCLFALKENNENLVPIRAVDTSVNELCERAILEYEKNMYNHRFHVASNNVDSFIRNINKYFQAKMQTANDTQEKDSVIYNTLHMCRVACMLLHSFVPSGAERVADYLGFNDKWYKWEFAFAPLEEFFSESEHYIKSIESKFDFFTKNWN